MNWKFVGFLAALAVVVGGVSFIMLHFWQEAPSNVPEEPPTHGNPVVILPTIDTHTGPTEADKKKKLTLEGPDHHG